MTSKNTKIHLIIFLCLILTLLNNSSALAHPVNAPQYQNEIEAVIAEGFDYIAIQLNEDGGVRWMDETSSVPATIRVVIALAAAGYSQDYLISSSGSRPIDFLMEAGETWIYQKEAEAPAFNVARAGQMLTAIGAANLNPHAFGERSIDLNYEIRRTFDPNTGIFGAATPDAVLDQAWAILGLAANHASVPSIAVDWLSSAQLEDGSWDDGYGSFLDTTPLGLMALISSGHREDTSPDVQAAIGFMMANQQSQGGWQTSWDTTTNANTTGTMLQAISALGQLPADENWQKEGGNPQTALIALQQENGAIGGDFANTYSTADAIIGLSGQTAYNLSYLRKINRSFDFILQLQDSSGGWGSVGQTIDVLLAAGAGSWDPNSFSKQDTTPKDFLIENLESYIESGPDAMGKSILGVVSLGLDPSDFAGIDLVDGLMSTYDENANAFGDPANTWHQSLGILGLYVAESEVPQGVVNSLIGLQNGDGGWEYAPGFGSSADTTALVLQALHAAGIRADQPIIQKGFEYIQSQQFMNAGWGDSSTTAYVIMALNAFQKMEESWLTQSGKTPLTALLSFQKQNGAFRYNWEYPEDNLMSTTDAMNAILGGDFLLNPKEFGETNVAGLVIDPGDAEVQTACVILEGGPISGLGLLDASGFSYSSQDGFMNSILEITNPKGETMYWSYWGWDGREWTFKTTGAGESVVLPGSIEAWHFTSWDIFPSLPPDYQPNLNASCNTKVQKNYIAQPYLNFEDIFPPLTAGDGDLEDIDALTNATQKTEGPQEAVITPSRSWVPLVIIGVFGVALIFVIIIFLKRRQK